MRTLSALLLFVAAPALADDVVICTTPNGSKYVGATPPVDCRAEKKVEIRSAPPTRDEIDRERAIASCEAAVKDQLLSPGTAEFPRNEMAVEYRGGNWYDIVGAVDSQAVGGILLRSDFSCATQFIGGDTGWRADVQRLISRKPAR